MTNMKPLSVATRLSALIVSFFLLTSLQAKAQGSIHFAFSTYTASESIGSATIQVNRTSGIGQVSIDYSTSNGTAVGGSDFTLTRGTITFLSGETTKSFTIAITDDNINEANEMVSLSLSNPQGGATLGSPSTATLTITDNDPLPSFSVDDPVVVEGNSGTQALVFTITLTPESGKLVSVDYGTVAGSAQGGSDFTVVGNTLFFFPGETNKTVSVTVFGDVNPEPNEVFFLELSVATNATISKASGTGTILNDDCPIITLNPSSLPNGTVGSSYSQTIFATGGTSPYSFALSSGVLPSGLTLSSGGVLSGTPSLQGTFNFGVMATDANGCQGSLAYVLVVDQTGISINDVSVTEPDHGSVQAVFTVTLSAASAQTVSVNFSTADMTATAGSDYTAATGTLTFSPGVTSQTISITVAGDKTTESNETFSVTLLSAVNGTITDASGVCTIINDDGILPSLSIYNEGIGEGDSGTKEMTFVVRLSKPRTNTVTVNYATSDGTAQAGSDYVATSGTLTFNPGEKNKTISVLVNGDVLYEGHEEFVVTLSDPNNATLKDGAAKGTIRNDDQKPKISINNVSLSEGNTGTVEAMFTVSLSNPSSEVVAVEYATENGTACAPADYIAASGTLTFNPGDLTQAISVAVVGDETAELDEAFRVRLKHANNATIKDHAGTGTIQDDDLPTLLTRYDDLINYVQSLPDAAFRKPSAGRRQQLLNDVNDSKSQLAKGTMNSALSKLQLVITTLSRTGSTAVVVDESARTTLLAMANALASLLTQQCSLAAAVRSDGGTFELTLDESEPTVVLPTEFELAQNYPNPFNPTTTIQYSLSKTVAVSLRIYNMLGEQVATLVDGVQEAGTHRVQWNAQVPSGAYVYRLRAGEFEQTKKMILAR